MKEIYIYVTDIMNIYGGNTGRIRSSALRRASERRKVSLHMATVGPLQP